jgi:PAS domain-containing protein
LAREIENRLTAWRNATREWERASPPSREVMVTLARSWLDYQLAVGAVGPDEIWLVADDEARYLAASESAARYLGVDMAAVLRLTLADVTRPSDRALAQASFREFLAAGTAAGEFSLIRPDGREVRAAFQATANTPVAGLHVSRLTPAPEWRIQRAAAAPGSRAGASARSAVLESRPPMRSVRGAMARP